MAEIPSGVIVLWPGNNGAWPSGWSRETSLDGRFPRGRTSGTAANSGGAAHNHTSASHSHPGTSHTHSAAFGYRIHLRDGVAISTPSNYGVKTTGNLYRRDYGPNSHDHSPLTSGGATPGSTGSTTATWNNTTTDPLNYEMIAIVSDGTPEGFPDDCVVFYNAGSAPTDWTNHTASAGRFIKAPASSGNGGATNSAGHAHSGVAHTHPAASGTHDHAGGTAAGNNTDRFNNADHTPNNVWANSSYQVQNSYPHNHTWDIDAGNTPAAGSHTSANTATETYVPPYHILLGIQNTSGADNWLEEAIVMWMGNTSARPDDWTICNGDDNDSGNATPNLDGKYIQMWASGGSSVGSTGGSAGHDHTNPGGHTHTQNHTHAGPTTGATPAPFYAYRQWYAASGLASYHMHDTFTSGNSSGGYGSTAQDVASAANTEPLYRTVGYLSSPGEPVSGGNVSMFGANF